MFHTEHLYRQCSAGSRERSDIVWPERDSAPLPRQAAPAFFSDFFLSPFESDAVLSFFSLAEVSLDFDGVVSDFFSDFDSEVDGLSSDLDSLLEDFFEP
jgi:hypothetical protein